MKHEVLAFDIPLGGVMTAKPQAATVEPRASIASFSQTARASKGRPRRSTFFRWAKGDTTALHEVMQDLGDLRGTARVRVQRDKQRTTTIPIRVTTLDSGAMVYARLEAADGAERILCVLPEHRLGSATPDSLGIADPVWFDEEPFESIQRAVAQQRAEKRRAAEDLLARLRSDRKAGLQAVAHQRAEKQRRARHLVFRLRSDEREPSAYAPELDALESTIAAAILERTASVERPGPYRAGSKLFGLIEDEAAHLRARQRQTA